MTPSDTEPDETRQNHDHAVIAQFTRWAGTFAALPVHTEHSSMLRMLAACALTPASRVLDVACGPGILACAMAEQAQHVSGIDLTEAMIGQARRRQNAAGLHNLEWHVGHAGSLPFEDGSFDCVTTRYSLHHMTDPGRILAEMKRVCCEGGRVVVIDATPAPESQTAYDRMERIRDPSHTSALTLMQLREVGRQCGLIEQLIDGYRLEAKLEELADPEAMPALTEMFEADIRSGDDRLGVQAYRAVDGLRLFFPISIIAWQV
ncbi:class I SAM-dependent methyltransferase [Granulibacter bethesdensis]|uniref:class I SAM-dependent methyltransferase n=1 Tax=Granulibacter bethesdensis TaxID=364410 RepID=UPI0003F1FE50|nr:methyltransferase domain-containing protein [Granulibacter bethesdensis]AHJ64686.1 SAM-dependent methyltransferase [Granulibacter bethesdensis CGDNIH4]